MDVLLVRKIVVSVINRKLRFSFAKSMINKPEMCWKNVLFQDKSIFNIFGSGCRIIAWRRKNEDLNPKNLVGTVMHCRGGTFV